LNAGVLAQRLGRDDDAVQRWEAALKTDAAGTNARRYLTRLWATRAEDFDKAGRTADAAHAFQRTLALDEQGRTREPSWRGRCGTHSSANSPMRWRLSFDRRPRRSRPPARATE